MSVSGSVKFFSVAKGWGFLVPDDGTEDVFIHKLDLPSGMAHKMLPDQRVSFDIIQTKKGNGRKAANVTVG